MNYYIQTADQLTLLYTASDLANTRNNVVATDEPVYMNPFTGSVDFASGWDDLTDVVRVTYNPTNEQWEEVE